MRKGRTFERTIASLEKALLDRSDISLVSPGYLVDRRTGRKREFDVLIDIPGTRFPIRVAIECRERKSRVGSPAVEAFHCKCEGVGVSKKVIVSSSGFSKPAIKLARALDVDCVALENVDSFAQFMTGGLTYPTRKAKSVEWYFRKAEGDLPLLLDTGVVLNSKGKPLSSDRLPNIIREALCSKEMQAFPIGEHDIDLHFPGTGLSVIPASGKRAINVHEMIARARISIGEETTDFLRFNYTDVLSGITTASVSIAEFPAGFINGWKIVGKLIFVSKEGGGGSISLDFEAIK